VGGPTLKRFFMLHFIVPLARGALIIRHLIILHLFGSVAGGGITRGIFKIRFFPKFILKDALIFGFLVLGFVFRFVIFLAEEENFLMADLVSSPLHIKPE